MADDSALVVVAPDDTLEAITQKVRSAGARSVELLIPDGTVALQALGGFARLRKQLEREQIGLLVISSDERTLNAARLNQIDALAVQGARVTLPPPGAQRGPYDTRVLSADELEWHPTPGPSLDKRDAEFLERLDEAPADRYAGEEDADIYAALDDLSETIQDAPPAGRRASSADEAFAAALDEWSEAADDAAPPRRPPPDEAWEERAPGTRRTRVRAEDIDLRDEAPRRGARRAGTRPRAAVAPRRRDLDEAEDLEPHRRVGAGLMPLILLLAIIVLIGAWFLTSRATIAVSPPPTTPSEHPIQGEVIPIAAEGASPNSTAVQARPIDADAEFTVQGQVASETLTPVGRARGSVLVINTLEQPIDLPANTEFVAVNPNNQEVRFAIDAPVSIPPSVTTTSLTGRSTTYGQIEISITARSPGSASNVGENSFTQILIPGAQPIANDSSLLIRNGPIGGGDEQNVRIVTQDDVQRVLGEALTGLYNAGIQQLREQIDESGSGIDLTTVAPDPQTLGKPESYEVSVTPPVGQQVDPANSTFSVTVRARFNALATPRDRSIHQQLQTVARDYFAQRGDLPCSPEEIGFPVSGWRWDGQKLTIDGAITCTPRGGVTADTREKVKNAVRGKSREEAEAALRALVQQRLIGGYVLPDKARFPGWDPLLDVQVLQSTAPTTRTEEAPNE